MDVPILETERLILTLGAPETAARYAAFTVDNEEHLARWEPPRPEGYFSEAYWYRRLERSRGEIGREVSCRLALFPPERSRRALARALQLHPARPGASSRASSATASTGAASGGG